MTISRPLGYVDRLRAKSLGDWRLALERRAALASRRRLVPMTNTRPVASFTFDDCPHSAATVGAGILEAHGARGTFYICGDLVDGHWEAVPQLSRRDLTNLVERGHEIGCHTYSHCRVTDLSRSAFEREITENHAFVAKAARGYEMTTFAYPFGSVGLVSKRTCDIKFAASRSIEPGVDAGSVDLSHVKSNLIPADRPGIGWLKPLIDEAVARNGWLTFFTHDVSDRPSHYGCHPETLEAAVAALKAAGIAILPVREAAAHVTAKAA